MAPPKHKTTGRTTAKGTQPGHRPTAREVAAERASDVASSSRYTPPTPKEFYESPRWVPILMTVLIGLGVLTIILRYIVWQDTNTPVLFGLAFLLGGLYTATKWH